MLAAALGASTPRHSMNTMARYTPSAEVNRRVQAMADTLNKKCYIALMPDSSLVITDNHNHIAGARQE